MVAAGEGGKYMGFMKILQEVIKDLRMTPGEGMTEGETAETAIAKEKPAMVSVGVQTETWAAVATATQTEMKRSVAVATQTEKQAITSIGLGLGTRRLVDWDSALEISRDSMLVGSRQSRKSRDFWANHILMEIIHEGCHTVLTAIALSQRLSRCLNAVSHRYLHDTTKEKFS